MTENNYTADEKDPITFQRRVTERHDFAAILFDPANPEHSVPAGQNGFSKIIDIAADKEKTLFVATVLSFTIRVQLTDDDDVNSDMYDLCDSSGAVLSFTCLNQKKAIPISIKAKQMRVVMTNNGASAEAPYVGVM